MRHPPDTDPGRHHSGNQRPSQPEDAGALQPCPAGGEAAGGRGVGCDGWSVSAIVRVGDSRREIASGSPQNPPQNEKRKRSRFRKSMILMVGTGRFELPTPRTPSECSTRLSTTSLIAIRYEICLRILVLASETTQWDFLSLFVNVNSSRTSHRQRWNGTSTASNGWTLTHPHKTT